MKTKVLLVDDLPDILAALRKLFSVCEVYEARDGRTALTLAAAQKPDLVILDVHLPDMSGVDVMEVLNVMDPKPVVIMLTGDDTTETTGKSLAAGAFAYVTKPFEPRDLVAVALNALEFAEKEKAKRKK
ncbi:MAG: response regulator [Elusimicrobiales bacterium]|nr:response regulator [Elusimicrobiales bacterium]